MVSSPTNGRRRLCWPASDREAPPSAECGCGDCPAIKPASLFVPAERVVAIKETEVALQMRRQIPDVETRPFSAREPAKSVRQPRNPAVIGSGSAFLLRHGHDRQPSLSW